MLRKLKKIYTKLIQPFHTDIAIELGARYIKIYQKGKGLVLNERFCALILIQTKRVIGVGTEAVQMLGPPLGAAQMIFPLRDSVVCDFEIYEQTLKQFLEKVKINKFCIGRPTCLLTHPLFTKVELNCTKDILNKYNIKCVNTPVVPLIFANYTQDKPQLSVHIGDGETTMYIGNITQSSKAESEVFEVSYNKMIEYFILHLRKKFDLLIGESSARRIFQELILQHSIKVKLPVKGRYLKTGEPKEIILHRDDVWQGIEEELCILDDKIAYFYEKQNKKMQEAIKKNGIILSGPGALIKNIDKRIHKKLKCPVFIVKDPENAVINGLGMILENPKKWENFCWKEIRK